MIYTCLRPPDVVRPVSAWRRGGTPPARGCHPFPAPCETSTRNSTRCRESSGTSGTAISGCVACLGDACALVTETIFRRNAIYVGPVFVAPASLHKRFAGEATKLLQISCLGNGICLAWRLVWIGAQNVCLNTGYERFCVVLVVGETSWSLRTACLSRW